MKPTMRVVLLQRHSQLLQTSVRSVSTRFENSEIHEDDFIFGGGGVVEGI